MLYFFVIWTKPVLREVIYYVLPSTGMLSIYVSYSLPRSHIQDSHGADVTDWLNMGHTIAQLLEIVAKTAEYATITPGDHKKLQVVGIGKFIDMNLPKHEEILSPILLKQSLAMIYAKRGIGKTYMALEIAYAVATGGCCLKWQALNPDEFFT